MRILHLVSSLSINSGIMNVIMNYYRNVNKNLLQFDFIYFKDVRNNFTDEIVSMGGRTYLIDKPSLSIKCYKKLSSFFVEHRGEYAVLHIHEVYLTFIFASIAKKNGIKNIITHFHSTKFSDRPIAALRNRLLCLPVNYMADFRFACSKSAGVALYGKRMFEKNKVNVIKNAINCEKFMFNCEKREVLRNELGINHKFVLGHVGRFSKEKNHIFLIDVFAKCKNINNNSLLLLIGDGPFMEQTKEKVRSLGLENDVIFLGQSNNMCDLYNVMDVFVLPSLFEGVPVVAVEAQCNGLPCFISSKITNEIAIDKTIFIDLSKSSSEWANIILSEGNIKRCSDIFKVRAANFDIKTEVKKLELCIYRNRERLR